MPQRINLHGGGCCGIKTLSGFPAFPNSKLLRKAQNRLPPNDRYGTVYGSRSNMYWENRPAETSEDRLREYLTFLKNRRPMGLVEVVLTSTRVHYWEATLLKYGFKRMEVFYNSNTNSKLVRFSLVMDGNYKLPIEK